MLTSGSNPYVVVPGAIIDTRSAGVTAIDSVASSGWTLTNNGTVAGGSWALQFSQHATVVNNGQFISPVTTAMALFGGADVTNAIGAVIAGKLDGVFVRGSTSTVVNAGDIAGDVAGLANTQSAIHMPDGGAITNLATGRIAGSASAILAAPATTVMNAGVIASGSKAAIDLTTGTSSTGGLVVNSGTITGGDSGTAILFGPHDDTLLITGTSAISGIVNGGAHDAGGVNTLILGGATAGAFDLSAIGPNAQYRNFDTLMKQDLGNWTLTGANSVNEAWQIAGGSLTVDGQLTGGITAVPQATGVDVKIASGGAVHAQTGSAISIGAASRIVNDGTIDGHDKDTPTLAVQGSGSSIVNTGTISADGAGAPAISLGAANGSASLVVNQAGATVSSEQGVAVLAGSDAVILNAGNLTGRDASVRFTGSNDVLTLFGGSNVTGDLDGGSGPGNALVLQGTGSLASRLYGFASLAMRGTDWTLAGDASVGAATVETGTLRVNGTLGSSATTVAPGAAIAGTGTVSGALVVQGTIAPGNAVAAPSGTAVSALPPLAAGTLHVAGTFAQAAGSRYVIEVLPTGNDLVDVTGQATLQGGTVFARLRTATFSHIDTYTIVSASAGLSGTYAGVSTLNPFVQPSLAYDANHAYLVVQRDFRHAGGTPNEVAVEGALDRGIAAIGSGMPPSRDFLSVAADLVNIEGPAAYAALDQLGAESYAALLNAHVVASRQTTDAIQARLADARGGSCTKPAQAAQMPADGDTHICSWAALLGNTGRNGGYDTWLTQQIDLAGAIAGIDYRVAGPVTVGAALSYVHGNTSTDTLPVHGQFDSYQVALYGSYVPGRYWLQGALGYARNDDEMKRDITFTSPSRTAQRKMDGNQYFASLQTGVDLDAGAVGVLSPFAGFEAQYVDLPGTTETGAGSVNLAVQSASGSAVRSLLGAQWHRAIDWLGHQWRVDATAAWAHEYGALTRAMGASFAGAPNTGFTVHGSGLARDAAQIELGTRVSLGRSAHLLVRYDGEFGGGSTSHAGSAGLDYRW
ncbi:autotransporter domain-containing protein [Paraburkholderia sp. LEh10]|uniref:autotransporter outer membrane beta-barrel domain-containing protein n=1 Tax=Paraburkholderia sp. LEh10 TaxID=2821353 RepID=UPI001AE47D50|nr:autotransporter domain-containing protein [Paraburkholderia sp. LEh10]MBP0596206.1 autotransporter domain-containing protein [Paraburkholderia sp. LEh10]